MDKKIKSKKKGKEIKTAQIKRIDGLLSLVELQKVMGTTIKNYMNAKTVEDQTIAGKAINDVAQQAKNMINNVAVVARVEESIGDLSRSNSLIGALE